MNYSKDGITVAPMLDVSHPKKSGRCPVKIRVTYKRKGSDAGGVVGAVDDESPRPCVDPQRH